MHDNDLSANAHATTLKAFYNRVICRVCSSLREEKSKDSSTERLIIDRLQQEWQEKLTFYTGRHEPPDAHTVEDDDDLMVNVAGFLSETDSDSDTSSSSATLSSSSSEKAAVLQQAVGRPSAQLPSAATSMTSSIFVKMLGNKRKLHQLDGSVSDDDDSIDEWDQAADLERRQESQQQCTIINSSAVSKYSFEGNDYVDDIAEKEDKKVTSDFQIDFEGKQNEVNNSEHNGKPLPSLTNSATLASSLISSDDVVPVSGLSGINLPLQLAAEFSKFGHRGIRRGYIGQLHAIILTWPKRLGSRETVRLGELVWYYSDSARGLIKDGELVRVISLGDTWHEVKIELGNKNEAIVSLERLRRLSEYVVRHGSVQFTTKYESIEDIR